MKETLKKVFHQGILAVVGVIFGIGIIFEYVVFPGLTAADTYLNILSALIGIFTIIFVYHFVQWKDIFEFLSSKNQPIPPGETEYDYIPKDEIVKKKKTVKKKPVKKRTGDIMTPKVSGEHKIKNGTPSIKTNKK